MEEIPPRKKLLWDRFDQMYVMCAIFCNLSMCLCKLENATPNQIDICQQKYIIVSFQTNLFARCSLVYNASSKLDFVSYLLEKYDV